MAESLSSPDSCLNCGRDLPPEAEYCPRCGQQTRGKYITIRDLLGDFVRDYFAFDSKFFRSIGLLLFRPGRLTHAYNEGKRMKYIVPIRFYIFVSFVYFLIMAASFEPDVQTDEERDQRTAIQDFKAGWTDATGNRDKEGDRRKAILDSALSDTTLGINRDAVRAKLADIDSSGYPTPIDVEYVPGDSTHTPTRLERFLDHQIGQMTQEPELFMATLFRAFSVSMFILLPIFALLLWLFHFKRIRYYVPHVIHSVHFHTFLFIFALILIGLNALIEALGGKSQGWFWGLYFSVNLVYLLISVRRVYGATWFSAFWKTGTILFIYAFVLMFAIVGVILGSLFLL